MIFGMMDELLPNACSRLQKFCVALFAGFPVIADAELAGLPRTPKTCRWSVLVVL